MHRRATSSLLGQPFSFSPGTVNGRIEYTALRLTGDYTRRSPNSVFAVAMAATLGIEGTRSAPRGGTVSRRGDFAQPPAAAAATDIHRQRGCSTELASRVVAVRARHVRPAIIASFFLNAGERGVPASHDHSATARLSAACQDCPPAQSSANHGGFKSAATAMGSMGEECPRVYSTAGCAALGARGLRGLVALTGAAGFRPNPIFSARSLRLAE